MYYACGRISCNCKKQVHQVRETAKDVLRDGFEGVIAQGPYAHGCSGDTYAGSVCPRAQHLPTNKLLSEVSLEKVSSGSDSSLFVLRDRGLVGTVAGDGKAGRPFFCPVNTAL